MATPSNRLPDKDQELSVRQGAFKFEPHSSDLMSASNNITSDRPGFSGFEDAYFGEPNNEDAVLTEAPAYSARTSYSFSGTPTEDALRSSSLRRVSESSSLKTVPSIINRSLVDCAPVPEARRLIYRRCIYTGKT